MYNARFTSDEVPKKVSFGLSYNGVYDENDKIVLGVNKKRICDLNKKQIATFSHIEESIVNGAKKRIRCYESNYGTFKISEDVVRINNQIVGTIRKKYKKGIGAALFAIALIVLTIGIIALIEVPDRNGIITIDLIDKDGTFEDGRTIGIFPEKIQPGSEGVYTFTIKNTENVPVQYTLDLKEMYNDEAIIDFPIRYKLKMNNEYIGDSVVTWLDGNELVFSQLIIPAKSNTDFSLEWEWPFENGKDPEDTDFGIDNGKYSLFLTITAQYYEETE